MAVKVKKAMKLSLFTPVLGYTNIINFLPDYYSINNIALKIAIFNHLRYFC